LWSGVTFSSNQAWGSSPLSNDCLNIIVIGTWSDRAAFQKTSECIPSGPCDLFGSILDKCFRTSLDDIIMDSIIAFVLLGNIQSFKGRLISENWSELTVDILSNNSVMGWKGTFRYHDRVDCTRDVLFGINICI